MNKLSLILIFIFFPLSVTFSKDNSPLKNKTEYEVPYDQSIICESELSIGFNWIDNKFVQTEYKNRKVIFKKINHNLKHKFFKWCNFHLALEEDYVGHSYPMLSRCYTKQYLGKLASPKMCIEFYDSNKNGPKLMQIDCEGFKFDPDGLFLKKPSNVSLERNKDYKDSFAIAHGKCARF